MKRIFLFIVAVMLFTSCVPLNSENTLNFEVEDTSWKKLRISFKNEGMSYSSKFTVVEIDGCEYLYFYQSGDGIKGVTHKGNCKHCATRKIEQSQPQLFDESEFWWRD